MAYYGYHRVSTKEQYEDRGVHEIESFCESRKITLGNNIYVDKISGKKFQRPRYTVLKEDVLRDGDTLIISEMDRLGRNTQQILKELRYYKDKGVRVIILEIPTTTIEIDTSNPLFKLILEVMQNLIIEIFAMMAEAEIMKKEKRQAEGIQEMKNRGEWDRYGRPHVMSMEDFSKVYERVLAKELKPFVAIKELGMSTQTYYRYRKEYESNLSIG